MRKAELIDERQLSWRIADDPGGADAVATALSRSHATLWYGSRCFRFSRTRDGAGSFHLRLLVVGHLLPAGFEAPVLLLCDDGCVAEQVIATDGERGAADVLQSLGRALFAEAARTTDLEARRP